MLRFERWKVIAILVVLVTGVILALPNLFAKETVQNWPRFVPGAQVNLGLDLQGGAHLLLEVKADDVVQERLLSLVDDVRNALRGDKDGSNDTIQRTGLRVAGKDAVTLRITDPADIPEAMRRLDTLATPTLNLFGTATKDIIVEQAADQSINVRLSESTVADIKSKAVTQSIEIVRRRVDELGTREPTIQRQGENRIIVEVPGESDPQRIMDLLQKTAKMTFHLVDTSVPLQEAIDGRVPPGSVLYPSEEPDEPFVLVKRTASLSGESLIGATMGLDQRTGEPVVNFRFDASGARRFAELSRQNVGRRFAIVLDGKIISAPVIREPILGGQGQISGNFTAQAANDLAILLRAGALPADLTVEAQSSVGPDLGNDSIRAGAIASVISAVLVVVFMLVTYGLFGLFADIALVFNVILMIAALSTLGATLTLPGIAGIVLTIGMAVDVNVIIFERIREEIRSGKSPVNAVEAGYTRSLPTILDSHITAFFAAIILFQLGTGPVKGFAVTLAIGLISSVFTGFTVARWLNATWLKSRRPKALPI